MPFGRLINRKIIDDYRLAQCDFAARLLFRDMILLADREARLLGDTHWVNNRFFPYDSLSDDQVETWLNQLESEKKDGIGLIERYIVEGRKYMWLPGFEGEQGKSWRDHVKNRERPSDIPPPPIKKGRKANSKPQEPTIKPSDILDPDLAEAVKYYEEKIGQVATPNISDRLQDLLDTYGLSEVKFATEEAHKNKAYNMSYIEKVLVNKHGEDRGHSRKAGPDKGLKDGIGQPLT